jgi:hypothetical protein
MDPSASAALGLLDKLLRERPDRVASDFSELTRWLTAYRDELIGQWRRTQTATDRQRLAQVNAVISVVLGGHYPLGEVPWDHIEKARAHLASVAEAPVRAASATSASARR